MIYINRNSLNKIVLTLTESTTISNVNYIFSFQPLATLDTYQSLIYFTTQDISNYTNRYNLFELTESDNGSTNGGNNQSLYLKPGQYEYKVYQSTSTSLNPNSFGDLIESGKLVVGDLTIEGQDTGINDDIYK